MGHTVWTSPKGVKDVIKQARLEGSKAVLKGRKLEVGARKAPLDF